MVFSSLIFLFVFLPLVLIVHALLAKTALRNLWLLVASLFFYAWGEGYLVSLMLFTIAINYGLAIGIDRAKNQQGSGLFLGAGIVLNLGLLVYFKYGNFIMDNLNQLRLSWDLEVIAHQAQPLPIGLSFFIFQAIAYLLDVYWGKIPAQKNPLRLGLYIALFPQLIAGPIVRYTQVAKQLAKRKLSWVNSAKGLERFFIGLAKKVLIADQLGFFVDQIFALPTEQLSTGAAWLGLVCYAGQIYFDFSGYSDMAIGIGRALGFRFPENFKYPYIAQSVREFWRRWHISLSTWFRDYLYIPLGGNRKGVWRTQFNLVLVFFLCGLWHGAAWNFVIWGLWHGLFLALERGNWGKWLKKSPVPFRHVYTLAVVLLAWVFFRAETLDQALAYFSGLFGLNSSASYYVGLYLEPQLVICLTVGILFSGPLFPYFFRQLTKSKYSNTWRWVSLVGLFLIMLLSIATMLSNSYSPFIYFRF